MSCSALFAPLRKAPSALWVAGLVVELTSTGVLRCRRRSTRLAAGVGRERYETYSRARLTDSVVNTKQPLCIARMRDLIASNVQVMNSVRAQIEERRGMMLKDMQRCLRRVAYASSLRSGVGSWAEPTEPVPAAPVVE